MACSTRLELDKCWVYRQTVFFNKFKVSTLWEVLRQKPAQLKV